jgi:hypothetical protein
MRAQQHYSAGLSNQQPESLGWVGSTGQLAGAQAISRQLAEVNRRRRERCLSPADLNIEDAQFGKLGPAQTSRK